MAFVECADCVYFEPTGTAALTLGTCHRHAPSPVSYPLFTGADGIVVRPDIEVMWPVVDLEDGGCCGEGDEDKSRRS